MNLRPAHHAPNNDLQKIASLFVKTGEGLECSGYRLQVPLVHFQETAGARTYRALPPLEIKQNTPTPEHDFNGECLHVM